MSKISEILLESFDDLKDDVLNDWTGNPIYEYLMDKFDKVTDEERYNLTKDAYSRLTKEEQDEWSKEFRGLKWEEDIPLEQWQKENDTVAFLADDYQGFDIMLCYLSEKDLTEIAEKYGYKNAQ